MDRKKKPSGKMSAGSMSTAKFNVDPNIAEDLPLSKSTGPCVPIDNYN